MTETTTSDSSTDRTQPESPDDYLANRLVAADIDPEDRRAVALELGRLLDMGIGKAAVLDLYALEVAAIEPEDWADARGVSVAAVRGGRGRAHRILKREVGIDE